MFFFKSSASLHQRCSYIFSVKVLIKCDSMVACYKSTVNMYVKKVADSTHGFRNVLCKTFGKLLTMHHIMEWMTIILVSAKSTMFSKKFLLPKFSLIKTQYLLVVLVVHYTYSIHCVMLPLFILHSSNHQEALNLFDI